MALPTTSIDSFNGLLAINQHPVENADAWVLPEVEQDETRSGGPGGRQFLLFTAQSFRRVSGL